MEAAAFLSSDQIISLRLKANGQLLFTCWAGDLFGMDRLKDWLRAHPRIKVKKEDYEGFGKEKS